MQEIDLDEMLLEAAGLRPGTAFIPPIELVAETKDLDGQNRGAAQELLGMNEFCELTGLHEESVRRHLSRGEWPGLKVGARGVWRIPRIVLNAVLAGIDPSRLKPILASRIVTNVV